LADAALLSAGLAVAALLAGLVTGLAGDFAAALTAGFAAALAVDLAAALARGLAAVLTEGLATGLALDLATVLATGLVATLVVRAGVLDGTDTTFFEDLTGLTDALTEMTTFLDFSSLPAGKTRLTGLAATFTLAFLTGLLAAGLAFGWDDVLADFLDF
jgi:hypothetical protein